MKSLYEKRTAIECRKPYMAYRLLFNTVETLL